MPIYEIPSFAAGLDVRKSAVTSPAGTLRVLENCHITNGGEIAKRRAFLNMFTFPAGTVGLAALNQKFYTFQNNTTNAVSPDEDILAIQTLDTSDTIEELYDWDVYENKLYVVVRLNIGGTTHFFDGQLVTGYKGRIIRTYKSKVHSIDYRGPNMFLSNVGDPIDWTGIGSGTINVATEDADSAELVGMEPYYGRLAVMSNSSTSIWAVDPDPANYQQEQVLKQAGTLSHKSLKGVGAGDVLYLSDTGVRSLRARDSSNAAAVSDIGSPIDSLITSEIPLYPVDDDLQKVQSLIEPLTGRFHMNFRDKAYVLSQFPSPSITAWSTYIFPFEHAFSAATGKNIGYRDTFDRFWILKSPADEDQYDGATARVLFPFLHLDLPGALKDIQSFDVACEGSWNVYMHQNPKEPEARDFLATIDGPTFNDGTLPIEHFGTHIQFEFETTGATEASISSLIVYYERGNAD